MRVCLTVLQWQLSVEQFSFFPSDISYFKTYIDCEQSLFFLRLLRLTKVVRGVVALTSDER